MASLIGVREPGSIGTRFVRVRIEHGDPGDSVDRQAVSLAARRMASGLGAS